MTRLKMNRSGSVTDPQGFSACSLHCGIKDEGEDFAMLVSDRPAKAAAVFTTNRLQGAPVKVSRGHVKGGIARAIVATSGNANVATGPRGLKAAQKLAVSAGKALGCPKEHVLIASTGPIGVPYPIDAALNGVPQAASGLHSDRASGVALARAIMTTDTVPKHASIKIGGATIGAAAKGAGMIHPAMATMFCFLTTDAAIPGRRLGPMLRRAVDCSFNMTSVDRDTSTSDTVFLLANGAKGKVDPVLFEQGLTRLCELMAQSIAADGEGASKLLRVEVSGCRSLSDARKAARAVVCSNLVKSAFHLMPIAGRVLSAVGSSGAGTDIERATIKWGNITVHSNNRPRQVDQAEFVKICSGEEIVIKVILKDGPHKAVAWGCDLSEDYVRCNADYYS